jgi:carbamoyltransferase
LREEFKERALCLAGGLFLNPLLVAAIEARGGFENVFVQPAAGNEGTALGAAWIVWHQQLGRARMTAMPGPYWGPAYSNEEIKKVLDNCKAAYHWCDSDEQKLGEAVRLLQAGKIVAWFQGAAEFGPRALGNRSLRIISAVCIGDSRRALRGIFRVLCEWAIPYHDGAGQ